MDALRLIPEYSINKCFIELWIENEEMFDDLAVFMFSGFVKPPAMACHPEHGHGLPGCVYGPQTEIPDCLVQAV